MSDFRVVVKYDKEKLKKIAKKCCIIKNTSHGDVMLVTDDVFELFTIQVEGEENYEGV